MGPAIEFTQENADRSRLNASSRLVAGPALREPRYPACPNLPDTHQGQQQLAGEWKRKKAPKMLRASVQRLRAWERAGNGRSIGSTFIQHNLTAQPPP